MAKIKDRTGEIRTMYCGQKASIIKYHNANNIDVKFEDNTIVYNKTYGDFRKGLIKHPSINAQTNNAAKNRIGETRMMSCGLKATLTQYNNAHDINIKFEDGITAYNKKYSSFKTGKIGHPNINAKTTKYATKCTGETRTMYCGQKASIIKYHNANNIDVKFEDGIVAHNQFYKSFKNGYIKHPNVINNIRLKEFAYKFNDDWYYICSHPTWMEDKILSVKEIYAYQPN